MDLRTSGRKSHPPPRKTDPQFMRICQDTPQRAPKARSHLDIFPARLRRQDTVDVYARTNGVPSLLSRDWCWMRLAALSISFDPWRIDLKSIRCLIRAMVESVDAWVSTPVRSCREGLPPSSDHIPRSTSALSVGCAVSSSSGPDISRDFNEITAMANPSSNADWDTSQLPTEPGTFGSNVQQMQMQMPPQPQSLIMPQWPSMLSSQAHSSYQSLCPQPVQPIQPMSIAPLQTRISAGPTRSTSTPRKTLTDVDRKGMCQYAEDHPNSKQTEIGGGYPSTDDQATLLTRTTAMFGVDRR